MKIGKFVGKNFVKFDFDAARIEKIGFIKTEFDSETNSIYFNMLVPENTFEGTHNGWYTNHKDAHFRASAKKVTIRIGLQEGIIENNTEQETITQYNANVIIRGGIGYYRRGKGKILARGQRKPLSETDHEIYNYYDYDTDIKILVERLLDYLYYEFWSKDIEPSIKTQTELNRMKYLMTA